MHAEPTFERVKQLAQLLEMPLLIYDLEASGFRGQRNFGITEVWCFVVTTMGNAVSFGSLINPECYISEEVQALTGITNEMVRSQPTWAHKFAGFFKEAAEGKYLVGGFNNRTFDNHAVRDMNARYGSPIEGFCATFDVRNLHLTLSTSKSAKGTLQSVAAQYGVLPRGKLHRAEADTVLTVELLDKLVEVYGLSAVARLVRPCSDGAEKRLSAVSIARYAKNKQRLSIEQVAKYFGSTTKDVSFEVAKAIDERLVNPLVFANDTAQEWLTGNLSAVNADTLFSGRLTPVFEALSREGGPKEVDYVQLRIGLLQAGLTWKSLKPV